MTRTGDWKKLQKIMTGYDTRIKKNCSIALVQSALELEGIIKDRIIKGSGMDKLHGFTIERKGSSKPLIDEADLLGSVGFRFIKSDSLFVGVHRKNENLSVSYLPGSCGILNCFNSIIRKFGFNDYFNFYLRDKVNLILRSSVYLLMASLSSKPFYFTYSNPFDTNITHRFFYIIQFEWFDDCFYLFHVPILL